MRRFASFREFYPFYLSEHANRTSRRLHFIGSVGVLVLLSLAVADGDAWWLLAALACGYGFAWIGHLDLAPAQGLGDGRLDHVHLVLEDLLQPFTDGVRLVAHLQGEIPEHAADHHSAALLAVPLAVLGGFEELLQPLQRLGVAAQNALPVPPLGGPLLVDDGEGKGFLGLEEVVEAALGNLGRLADLGHTQRRISPLLEQ